MTSQIGFVDTFARGISDTRWGAYNWQWGANNNGCVPEYIRLETDNVVMWDGTRLGTRNVAAIYGHGERTTSTPLIPAVNGVDQNASRNRPKTRVGACMVTRASFGSGQYDVDVRFWNTYNGKTPTTTGPSGTVFSAWTFHYETHRAKAGDSAGNQLNPADLQYQPALKQGSAGAYYSVVNSEIDAPEYGIAGNYNEANYNTWLTEMKYDIKSLRNVRPILDGRYHRYSFRWANQAVPLPGLKSTQVTMANGYLRINAAGVFPAYQGYAVVRNADGTYSAIVGKSVSFYMDGQLLRTTSLCSAVPARFVIGNWFANWAGAANWEYCKFTIARVAITPSNSNDLYLQKELSPAPLARIPGSIQLAGEERGVGAEGDDSMLHDDRYLGISEERRPKMPSLHDEREYESLLPADSGADIHGYGTIQADSSAGASADMRNDKSAFGFQDLHLQGDSGDSSHLERFGYHDDASAHHPDIV